MPRPMGDQLLVKQPFEVVALDYMNMVSSRDGKYNYVLVIVNQLTRITLCIPKWDNTAVTAAKIFVEH